MKGLYYPTLNDCHESLSTRVALEATARYHNEELMLKPHQLSVMCFAILIR